MSMLNIGTSALLTTQTSLATTSHNISNVNTEGYSRQRVIQVAQPPNFEGRYYVGTGVNVSSVERIFDTFLADQVRTFTSQERSFDIFTTFARQVDDLLGAPELSLSSGLQGFFDAIQDVADDPTSISARQVMLTEADTLAKRFNTMDAQLKAFNDQVNLNLDASVNNINSLSKGIAELNKAIIEASDGIGIPPNDLLDQRDQLINQLSTYVSVSTNVQSNGAVNVFVGSGQGLVIGQSAVKLSIITDPLDSSRSEIGYGPSNINVSAQLTGGSIGGLLSVRKEVIDPARDEINALAAGLINTINAQHAVGLTLDGQTGGNFFEPADPLTQDAGSIRVAIINPRDIAIAFPVSTTTNPINTGTAQLNVTKVSSLDNPVAAQALAGDIKFNFDSTNNQYTVTYQGETALIPYTPDVDSGKTFDLATLGFTTTPDLKITLSGIPANSDSFTISNSNNGSFSAVGDNRNALALGQLQIEKTLNPVGGVATRSFGDAYGILVANVATRTHQADVGQQTQKGLLDQTTLRYESVSGVNLDEEAANLIKFQQAYQAASQIITVSNTVFNSLMSAL